MLLLSKHMSICVSLCTFVTELNLRNNKNNFSRDDYNVAFTCPHYAKTAMLPTHAHNTLESLTHVVWVK